MKVVTGKAMQEIDRRAIEEFGIAGLTLMENAGRACADFITGRFAEGRGRRKAAVVAGKGNNGGDGYVIARLLGEMGWQVAIFVIASKDEITGGARSNLNRLSSEVVKFCEEAGILGRYVGLFQEADVIVDALVGTGLKSPLRGAYAEAVEIINAAERPVVAVDIPSGIDAADGRVLGVAVKADATVTFGLAKCGHVLFPGAERTGSLHIADIGIPPEVTAGAVGPEYIDAATASTFLLPRGHSAHKGNFGHCLIVAGSTGKTGAAAMAANSAVRAGAGLVTLAVPATLNSILEMKTTEAMTMPLYDNGRGYLGEEARPVIEAALSGKNAIAIGPGLGSDPGTARLVRDLVAETNLPMVVDADGLNALSEDPSVLFAKKSSKVILTPHPGEMARLCGLSASDIEADRMGAAQKFAKTYQVYVVLKGAGTVIATPEGELAINGSGNPGMASGGMGDLLTGVLAALLAQGYPPFEACRLGVFIHGHAADMVAAEKGKIGMTALDVQEQLPYACKQLLIERRNRC
jgi:NAD(P)H-hydrate epimerase